MAATTTLLRLIAVAIATAILSPHLSSAQLPAPSPASAACNGIYLTYTYTGGSRIPPTVPANQPYSFRSTLTVLNNAARELKSWRAFVGFQHGEYLVSASNAVLADGNSIPGYVNGTVFAGYPATDLKTAIETAGDLTQMSVRVDLVGTQFGVDLNSSVPMPSNISLANDGFRCPAPTFQGRNQMHVCCVEDPNATTNITVIGEFLPRQDGDLTIMYDVIRTYDTSYWAQVTISNHNPLGRLDNWNLTWDWMREEFINSMRGAYPYVRDSSECIFGSQGQYYKGVDFANVLNCERSPTIIDLPLNKANDTNLGLIPFCCRNGTILPRIMDPSQSVSSFQVEVYKMPPDLNRSQLNPPQNFRISGRLGPDYQCGPLVRVSPSQFPDPNGLPSEMSAVASWQVVCNITVPKNTSPKCCVSFSAYYNESIIPCPTCACGCPTSPSNRACSAAAPALFLPSQALLVPFDNRTALATAWANIQHRSIPNPLPCGDNCGVSINWHLLTDYRGGWTSRITVFNWDDSSFADWFVAVEMDKASAGFEKAYSFNSTTLGVNNTIFMQGLTGLNYLVGETDGADPAKDPRVPGKQQSVLSFTKKLTPGIDVVGGDGFPTRVLFNGEECALPRILPTSNSHKKNLGLMFSVMLSIAVLMLMQH